VLHEAAHVIRLAPAVGEDHRDVRDENRAQRRHQDQPPQVAAYSAIAMAKQITRMPIMIRYRCCRYLMSSGIGRRAWAPSVPPRSRGRPGWLAWLTDHMLNASTRSGGMAARLT
jgi:hypothetical protein